MSSTRRDLLILGASSVSLQSIAFVLKGGQEHSQAAVPASELLKDYAPRFFAPEDFAALQAFVEILIPTDDMPGAKEARCAQYIDFLLHASGSTPGLQRRWLNAMATLRALGFHTADERARSQLVREMAAPERDPGTSHPGYEAFRLIKELNTFAFYSSRPGLIEALDYRGDSYNLVFPACSHPDHQQV